MPKIVHQAQTLMENQNFDSLAFATLDFKNHKYECFELTEDKNLYYDLASLTKPLTLSFAYQKNPKLFDNGMKLLLDHRGGLPSWGRLSKDRWKETLESFEIKESSTEYSDYSALRLMLEIQKKGDYSFKDSWHQEVCFYKDLKDPLLSPPTGFREGREIRGVVHDPNAYIIESFCTHAGLFGTIKGLSETLMNFNKSHDLIENIMELYNNHHGERFIAGFDRVQDQEKTLAGKGHSLKTFGHLGFTGTSFWIDGEKLKGHIILANGTQNYWYQRQGLQHLRRTLGEALIHY